MPDLSRSPQRRRSSPDRYRRRSRSPDERSRRSRSPGHRRRASPDYNRPPPPPPQPSGYRDHRDHGDMPPPPPRYNHNNNYRHQGGEYRDPTDGIHANSQAEYRRLKRLQLAEQNVNPLWRNTPSPPPGQHHDDAPLSDDEARAHAKSEKQARRAAKAARAGSSGGGDSDASSDSEVDLARQAVAAEAAATAAVHAAVQEVQAQYEEQLGELDEQECELYSSWMAGLKAAQEAAEAARLKEEEDNAVIGPELPGVAPGNRGNYGGFLRPGEGDAMAAYVQSGKRIPRRGEVGLNSDQIEHFEDLGYIMSGSRHSRMNAVRIRKENQIYSAEEKAALAMFNFEENKRKEAKVLTDMKRLVEATLGTEGEPVVPQTDVQLGETFQPGAT